MVNGLIAVFLLLSALINFGPVMGVFSAERMNKLYDIELVGSDMLVLMHHRALLFGIVGGFMLCAVVLPSLRPAAYIMGFLSMIGFIVIAWTVGGYNDALQRIVSIDVAGTIFLAISLSLYLYQQGQA